MHILEHIEAIRATKGTKLRKAYLAERRTDSVPDQQFRLFAKLAMESTTNLYLSTIPEGVGIQEPYTPFDQDKFSQDLVLLVHALSKREYRTRVAVAEAIQAFLNVHNNAEALALLDMVVQRTLRVGLAETSFNEVYGSDFLTQIPYQGCTLPKDSNLHRWPKDKDGNWWPYRMSQIKSDGMYANVSLENGLLKVQTRNGRLFPVYDNNGTILECWKPILGSMHKIAKDTQVQGELLLIDANGKTQPREVGNGVFNSLLKEGEDIPLGATVILVAWDQIPVGLAVAKGVVRVRYQDRFAVIDATFSGDRFIRPAETVYVHNMKEANAHLLEALARGEEGTILKNPDAFWQDGKSPDQVKFKIEFEVELELTGFVPGDAKGKNADTFGSLLLSSADRLLEVSATGITDADRQKIHNDRDHYLGGVFTVKANDITEPTKPGQLHSLFLPNVKIASFRPDKSQANTLPEIQAHLEAAIKGGKVS